MELVGLLFFITGLISALVALSGIVPPERAIAVFAAFVVAELGYIILQLNKARHD